MATETDAARDRVLAARAGLGEELENLEASVRTAVDVPAKIRRHPARAAAVAGGAGFLVLGGPGRVFRTVKSRVTGAPADFPESMLPKEIDKTLRKLGDDGDKVRGAIERDFAAYAKKAVQDRRQLRTLLLLTVARPLLSAAAKRAASALFGADEEGFMARLEQIRERTRSQTGAAKEDLPVTERAKAAEEQANAADGPGPATT